MKKLFVLFFFLFFLISFFSTEVTAGVCPSQCLTNGDCRGCGNSTDYYCLKYAGQASGHCQLKEGNGGGGGGNGVSANLKCNCTTDFGACGDKFGKTNIQWRQCTPKVNGTQTCNWRVLTTLYQYKTCPTATPTPPETSGTPAPTENPNCLCNSSSRCTLDCQFNKYTTTELPGVTYPDQIKCGLANSFFQSESVPTVAQKTGWCQAEMRTKGDADGNGNAALKDYFYYVAAKSGAKIPPTVNPDFNGDNAINVKDRDIILKSLGINLPD